MSNHRHFFSHIRVVSLLTLASRVLGLVRDVISAAVFGRGAVWGAFTIAFVIPNLFRRLFGEGALSAVFIPAFTRRLATDRAAEARRTFRATLTFLVTLMALIVVAGELAVFAARPLADGNTRLALRLVSVMAPYALVICATALGAAALQSLGAFGPASLPPIILNLFWIASALAAWRLPWPLEKKIFLIAFGVVAGAVAALVIEWLALARRQMAAFPMRGARNDPGLAEIKAAMLPILAGLAVFQVNTLADHVIAWTFVAAGANATLYYANRLIQFPLAVLGLPVAVAVFPALAELAARNRRAELASAVRGALGAVFFLTAPAAVYAVILR